MHQTFKAVKVREGLYWVGAIDWAIRDFHGYATSRGTTYNAFLVLGESPILIDTVKAPFYDEMMARIASVIDPKDIELIISNHSEMDHSGCLTKVIDEVKPKKVLASKMGVKALKAHFGDTIEGLEEFPEGGVLETYGVKLHFIETRMLHWPDSMFTYMPEEKTLFSQDGFGMHLATYERFADQIPRWILEREAAKYYANILNPYSPLVAKLLAKTQEMGLEVDLLLPDHGPIYRTKEDIEWIIGRYANWSSGKLPQKVVVFYDTMWGSTDKLARAIGEGIASRGVEAKLLPLGGSHRSDVATELLSAGGLVVGSPTLNNNMFPSVADVLTYVKGLGFKGRIGAAFGSYGWGGESVKQVAQVLEEMGTHIVDTLKVQYVPDQDDLYAAYQLGVKVAEELKEKT